MDRYRREEYNPNRLTNLCMCVDTICWIDMRTTTYPENARDSRSDRTSFGPRNGSGTLAHSLCFAFSTSSNFTNSTGRQCYMYVTQMIQVSPCQRGSWIRLRWNGYKWIAYHSSTNDLITVSHQMLVRVHMLIRVTRTYLYCGYRRIDRIQDLDRRVHE